MSKKLRLDYQLCFPIYAASRLMSQMYAPHFKKHQLTYPQYLVFLVLWEKSPRKVTEIADLLLLDTGTVTPLIKRMELKGWLTRQRSAADERAVEVALSEKGRALEEHFQNLPDDLLCDVDCKKSELADLRNQLNKLNQELTRLLRGGTHE